jgi:hypothetical protein
MQVERERGREGERVEERGGGRRKIEEYSAQCVL